MQTGNRVPERNFLSRWLHLAKTRRSVTACPFRQVASEHEFIADGAVRARIPFPAFPARFRRSSRAFLKRSRRVHPKHAGKDETSRQARELARRSKHNFFISRFPSGLSRAVSAAFQAFLSEQEELCRLPGKERVTFLPRGISFIRDTLE